MGIPELDPDFTVIFVTDSTGGAETGLVLRDVDKVTERPDGRLFVRRYSVFPWGSGKVIEPEAGVRAALTSHPSFQRQRNADGFVTWKRGVSSVRPQTWSGKVARVVRKVLGYGS